MSNMLGWEGSLPPTLCSVQLGIYSFLFSLRYPAPPKKVPLPTLRIYNDAEKGE